MYTVHCTLYIIPYTLYSVHYTLYSVHYISNISSQVTTKSERRIKMECKQYFIKVTPVYSDSMLYLVNILLIYDIYTINIYIRVTLCLFTIRCTLRYTLYIA